MLTVAEAAKQASRDPETIRRWIRAGRLAAWKVGGQHMIDEAALASAISPTPSISSAADTREPVAPEVAPQATAAAGHRVGEAAAAYGSAAAMRSPATAAVPAPVIDARLPHIVGRIVRGFDPARIVLFGPRAHGDRHPDAEYKLLVVLDTIDDRWTIEGDVRLSFAKLPVFAQIVAATTEEVEGRVPGRPVGLTYWALQEGVTIYERHGAA